MTERSRQVQADLVAWEESESKSQAKLQREVTRLIQEIRLHSPVLARPKRSRTIVSGNVVGFIDEEAFLVAIDGQSNPWPATSSDMETLARRPVIQNGRRRCLYRPRHPATGKPDGHVFVVEAVSISCESVEIIDENLRAQCEAVRERLLADDGAAHVMADLLLSKGLIAPTGLFAEWTLGDLFPMAYAFRMSEECGWDFHDCVEDLESYLTPGL